MGATESIEQEVPTDMDKQTSIQNEEIIQRPENIGKNKIISLLGLDDHEKYFESTDSEISELNEENNKMKSGEILYFNQTTFQSNSTMKGNDYCMRKRCGAVTPKVGEFVNIIDGVNNNGINEEDCEMDCPSKLPDNNKIESNSLPPHKIATSPYQTSCHAQRKSPRSSVPRCNISTCPAWNKLQNDCADKCSASIKQKNMKECTKSNNNKDVSDANMINLPCNKSSRICKEYLQSIEDNLKDSIPSPPPKPTRCLEPDTCRRVKPKSNSPAQDVTDLPGTTYSHRNELPISSRSAPQQQCTNLQSAVNVKFVPMTKPPAPVPLPTVHKKMQDTGTNTSITEERRPCDKSNKVCQLNANITPHRQEKSQTCNRRKHHKSNNSKSSTNYTYDEETTQSSGYTNCETEIYNTTYSSDSPCNRIQDGPYQCQCVQCQYEYHAHHATGEHLKDVSSDEVCSNFSDRSINNEYLNLAYQKAGDYPVLVNELESTLSHRNRNHVKNTMKRFEMLGSHNNKLEKPLYEHGESSYDLYDSNCYEKEYCCHKCQRVLQNHQHDFHYANIQSPLNKYATNQQIGNTIGDGKNKSSQNETRNKNFNSTLLPGSGHVEKTANFVDQQLNYKMDKYSNMSGKCGNKHAGWKMNSHTGDWEKIEEMENYDYDWDESPMTQPSSLSKMKQDGFVHKKNITNKNASPCICPTCQCRQ